MNECDAKIRPFPNDTELQCELRVHERPNEHQATLRNYAGTGGHSVITWMEADRRTFRGEWARCPERPYCVLPMGHRGNHEA